ncbi:MAG: type II secretion system protein [Pseudomonadales bacterium]|nr:type II secretion system protein [Pseudomonadales bacterium]
MFSKKQKKSLMSRFSKIDVSNIQDNNLRTKAVKLKGKQSGFTLLELLVVVAILAAIAGTATIALQDTDARASAAAHVAMMDELNKGIRTFRVLNKNQLPNNLDSLVATATSPVALTPVTGAIISVAAIDDVALVATPLTVVDIMGAIGMTEMQYIDESLDDGLATTPDCTDLEGIIGSRANQYVAGNIFLTPAGNGCGVSRTLEGGDELAYWTGGQERIIGQPADAGIVEFEGTNLATATGTAYLATGLGPASSLFDGSALGGLTSVPVYRHVSATEYNRFIALWNVGSFDGAGAIVGGDQVSLAAIVDGAGDTKEEELGEWDGTRNTI